MTTLTAPIKLKTFVRAKSYSSCSKSKDSSCSVQNFQLNNNETSQGNNDCDVSEFYSSIVSESSTTSSQINNDDSSDCQIYEERVPRKQRKKKHKISYHPNQLTVNRTKVFIYCQENNLADLKSLTPSKISVDCRDDYGWSLLMIAACAGAVDVVEYLLKNGAKTGTRDSKGYTAVYLASMKHRYDVVDILTTNICEQKYKPPNVGSCGFQIKIEDSEKTMCEECKVEIDNSLIKNHQCSIPHLLTKGPGNTHPSYAIPFKNKGYQLLLHQGWDSKHGLGPEGKGKLYPVKTILKRDRKGLGLIEKAEEKITHFGPKDPLSVKRIERECSKNKMKLLTEVERKKNREIVIRRSLKDL